MLYEVGDSAISIPAFEDLESDMKYSISAEVGATVETENGKYRH